MDTEKATRAPQKESRTMRGRHPKVNHWTEQQVGNFRKTLRAWMVERSLDPEELEGLLGYRSGGYLVRMYLGELETDRPPSLAFRKRLEDVGFSGNGRGLDFPAELRSVPSGVVAAADLPSGTIVLGTPRQCPECVAEAEEGRRHPARTWYVFAHPNQKYCSPEHRRAWYRRRRRKASSKSHIARPR